MKKKKARRTHVNRNLPKLGGISIPIPEGWFEVTSGELERGDRYLDPDMLDSENEYDWWVPVPAINGRQLNVESLLAVIRKGEPDPEVTDHARELVDQLSFKSQHYGEVLAREDDEGGLARAAVAAKEARKDLLKYIASLEEVPHGDGG